MSSMSSASPPARRRTPALALITLALVLVLSACAGTVASDPASQPPGPMGSSPEPMGSSPAPMGSSDLGPSASDEPSAEAPATLAAPRQALPRVPPLQPPAYASRVVIEDLDIDLPVVSGDLQPPPNYPFCDVAAYVTRFGQPYEMGVTYISAHAQSGMFAPLLMASERADGAELVGMKVQVFVSDGRRFDYVIERVVRHAVDYAVLAELPLDEQVLILQTSEGRYGTIEKLQVSAAFESETTVEPAVAAPEPSPRDCRPDELFDPTAD